MFSNTNLKNITSDFSSLVSGLGMFENTDLSKTAIENIAKSIPSLTKTTTITSTETDENGELIDELVNIFENGVSFKYNYPTWDNQTNKISNLTSTLKIKPNEVGIITITWKNPGVVDPADALIIEREYFKLMNIKGWTVVTNLRENENGTRFTREINGIVSTGTLVLGPKAAEWQEITIN
jgi:predicted AAA+ superfamily ATPase